LVGLRVLAVEDEALLVMMLKNMLADLGIAHRPRPDHTAYLAHWLDVLKNDPQAIFTAAAKARAAVDWMWAQQPSQAVAGAG
jgi:antirestriction protein ArdC